MIETYTMRFWENQETSVSEAKRSVYFKSDRMASCMEGYLEIEKDDWNVSIGFDNMRDCW